MVHFGLDYNGSLDQKRLRSSLPNIFGYNLPDMPIQEEVNCMHLAVSMIVECTYQGVL